MGKFSHLDDKNKPKMVNVIDKKITKRRALAQADMFLGKEIIDLLDNDDIKTKKGPVFQTAPGWSPSRCHRDHHHWKRWCNPP